MKITKQEVKTIYDIEINFKEAWDLLVAFGKKQSHEVFYPNLVEHLKNKDCSVREVAKSLFEITICMAKWHSEMIQYFVKELGFDGIVNYGLFNESKRCYRCVVYNYGDCVNK